MPLDISVHTYRNTYRFSFTKKHFCDDRSHIVLISGVSELP
jgi:hypothetical protein